MITVLLGLIAWGGLAVALGIAIGLSIRDADRRAAADRDPLADQPVEVLADVDVDARFARIAERLPTREWLA